MNLLILAAICLASGFTVNPASADHHGDDAYQLRADLPFLATRSNPVTHEVDFSVVVTPPAGTDVLRVWLPVPQDDRAQTVIKSELSTFPESVQPQIDVERVFGNKFAYFEFHKPLGAQIIRHRFSVTVWQLDWQVSMEDVDSDEKWPPNFQPYLTATGADRQVEELMATFVSDHQRPADSFVEVMDWIDANFTYDHKAASLNADISRAIAQRSGHCSDYHGLCATMGRKLGLPARLTYGWSLFPKHSPSHCKLEVFLPPYGWVSFDLSETQKMVHAIERSTDLDDPRRTQLIESARDRLKRGFRENSWLSLTRGTDYELVPRASSPVRVIRTIYAEADGRPLTDPDPANPDNFEFSWMTAHKYQSDQSFKLPFKDFTTLTDSKADRR